MVNKNVKTVIDNSIEQNKISHCYLLNAEANLNIDDSVLYIINSINKTEITDLNPETLPSNVLFLEDDLSKDKVLSVLETSVLASFIEKQIKFIIMKNIDRASKATLNALLKIIEEPSSNTCFILTTNNLGRVLDTIQSRSIIININRAPYKVLEKELIDDGFKKKESWFYSYIFIDFQQAKKFIDKDSFELVEELIKAINKSISNKYHLYVFLTKYTKKDSKKKLTFLMMALRFILSWSWNPIIAKEAKMSEFVDKLSSCGIDFSDCFIVIDDFLRSTESNENYFLQTERALTKLMELYE